MTALAAAHGADELGDLPALTDGYSAALLGAAGIAAAAAVLAAVTFKRHEAGATPAVAQPEAAPAPR